ncbi:MAG: hypothetical protein U0791_25345 [Gemmataceae bacterium]
MTATAAAVNGRPQRKLLSEELDRLDSIIDSLAEGLPVAVAAAAREGTRAAMKDAIIEIIANPELRALLQGGNPAPIPAAAPVAETAVPHPSLWARIKAKIAATKAAVSIRVRAAAATVARTARTLVRSMPVSTVATVTGAGVLVAAAIHFAPTGLTAGLAVVTTAVAAGLLRLGNWFRCSAKTLLASG